MTGRQFAKGSLVAARAGLTYTGAIADGELSATVIAPDGRTVSSKVWEEVEAFLADFATVSKTTVNRALAASGITALMNGKQASAEESAAINSLIEMLNRPRKPRQKKNVEA